jgi:hypothetical protein
MKNFCSPSTLLFCLPLFRICFNGGWATLELEIEKSELRNDFEEEQAKKFSEG